RRQRHAGLRAAVQRSLPDAQPQPARRGGGPDSGVKVAISEGEKRQNAACRVRSLLRPRAASPFARGGTIGKKSLYPIAGEGFSRPVALSLRLPRGASLSASR